MDIYAKGQLSFLILNCLLDRDFYGLDIITEVKNRSNGRINLKKPSVYSNLTRMEKQGMVSSYMRSSEVGPNRKYYSVTEKGRNTYNNLQTEFERNHFDVFRDYVDETEISEQPTVQSQPLNSEEPEQTYYISDGEVEQEDFFDFSSLQEESTTNKTDVVKKIEPEDTYQEPLKTEPLKETEVKQPEPSTQVESKVEPIKVEEVKTQIEENKVDTNFLPKNNVNDPSYNQRIYDITKDFNRYRKKRSFAEDQMAMEVSDSSFQEAEAKRQERLDTFKTSLLANKGNKFEGNDFEKFQTVRAKETTKIEVQPEPDIIQPEIEKEQDDGVFITNHVTTNELFKTKKIEPPRLKINANANNLPAPNRDTSIDPSHKEIISRIYSKSKGSVEETQNTPSVRDDALYDYADLQDFYISQSISFKAYEQHNSTHKVKHNTNKLELVSSVITFILMCVVSGVIFTVLKHFNYTNANTDFLYLLLPALYLIEVAINTINMRHTSWEPKPMWPQWLIWVLMLLSIGVTFGLNFIFGMNINAILNFATTLILPCGLLLILFPIRYYIKRTTLVKFWK